MLSIQNVTSSLGQTVTEMLPRLYFLFIQQPATLSLGVPL